MAHTRESVAAEPTAETGARDAAAKAEQVARANAEAASVHSTLSAPGTAPEAVAALPASAPAPKAKMNADQFAAAIEAHMHAVSSLSEGAKRTGADIAAQAAERAETKGWFRASNDKAVQAQDDLEQGQKMVDGKLVKMSFFEKLRKSFVSKLTFGYRRWLTLKREREGTREGADALAGAATAIRADRETLKTKAEQHGVLQAELGAQYDALQKEQAEAMKDGDVEGKNTAVREAEARAAALETAFEALKGAKERAVAMQATYDAATGEEKAKLATVLANLKQDVSAKVADLKKLNVLPKAKGADAATPDAKPGTPDAKPETPETAEMRKSLEAKKAEMEGLIDKKYRDLSTKERARITELEKEIAELEPKVAAIAKPAAAPEVSTKDVEKAVRDLEALKAAPLVIEGESAVNAGRRLALRNQQRTLDEAAAKGVVLQNENDIRASMARIREDMAADGAPDATKAEAERKREIDALEAKIADMKKLSAVPKLKEAEDALAAKRTEQTALDAKIKELETPIDVAGPEKTSVEATKAFDEATRELEALKATPLVIEGESTANASRRLALRNQQRTLDEAAVKGVVLQNENDIRASMARIREDMAADGAPDTTKLETERQEKIAALEAKVKELEKAKRDAETAHAAAKEKATAAEAAKPEREKELASLKEKKTAMEAEVKKLEEDVAREKAAKPAPTTTETPPAVEKPAGEYDEADDLLSQREGVQATAKEAQASAEKALSDTLASIDARGFNEKFARLEAVQTQLGAQVEALNAWSRSIVETRTNEVFDRIQAVRGGRIDEEKAAKLKQIISERLVAAANDAAVNPANDAAKEFRAALGTSKRKWGAALDTVTTLLLIKGLSVAVSKAGAAYVGDVNNADLLRPIPHKAPTSTIAQVLTPETPIQVQDSIWNTVQANGSGLSNAETLARTNRIIELANQKHLLGDAFGQLTASNFDAAGHLLSSGTDIQLTAEQLARVTADADIATIIRGGALG